MFFCYECCVLSGRGLCGELITRPEESYRLWYVVVCDLETSWMRRPWTTGGCRAKIKENIFLQYTDTKKKLCFMIYNLWQNIEIYYKASSMGQNWHAVPIHTIWDTAIQRIWKWTVSNKLQNGKKAFGPTNGKVEENFKDIRIPRQNYFISLMQKPIEKVTSNIRLFW
jgi:hypothetical protein